MRQQGLTLVLKKTIYIVAKLNIILHFPIYVLISCITVFHIIAYFQPLCFPSVILTNIFDNILKKQRPI